MAEDQYVNGVIGMHPSSDLATEVDIEPVSIFVLYSQSLECYFTFYMINLRDSLNI